MRLTASRLPLLSAIIHRRDDVEDKLVVSVGGTWDAHAIASAVDFQERYFDPEIVTETSA